MKRRFIISSIIAAAGHFVLAMGSLLLSLGSSMAGFDDPDYRPTFLGQLLDRIAGILNQPGVSIWTPWMSRNLPDPFEWIVFLGNSLLWGVAIALAILFFQSRAGADRFQSELSSSPSNSAPKNP